MKLALKAEDAVFFSVGFWFLRGLPKEPTYLWGSLKQGGLFVPHGQFLRDRQRRASFVVLGNSGGASTSDER